MFLLANEYNIAKASINSASSTSDQSLLFLMYLVFNEKPSFSDCFLMIILVVHLSIDWFI